jgi:copper resistance protein C
VSAVPSPSSRAGLLRPRPFLGALARGMALTAAALLGLAAAGPAAAHDALVGSEPEDGQVLDVPPKDVVLSFSADQLDVGASVVVLGPDGHDHGVDAPVVDGRTVTQQLDGRGAAGEWSVDWRSVSGDGHPITGRLVFTVTAPATDPRDDLVEDGPDTPEGDPPTDEPAATTTDGPTAAGSSAEEIPLPATRDVPGPLLAVGLGLGAVAAAATVWLLIRRFAASRPDEPGPGRDDLP